MSAIFHVYYCGFNCPKKLTYLTDNNISCLVSSVGRVPDCGVEGCQLKCIILPHFITESQRVLLCFKIFVVSTLQNSR